MDCEELLEKVLKNKDKRGVISDVVITNCEFTNINQLMKKWGDVPLFTLNSLEGLYFTSPKIRRQERFLTFPIKNWHVENNVFNGTDK